MKETIKKKQKFGYLFDQIKRNTVDVILFFHGRKKFGCLFEYYFEWEAWSNGKVVACDKIQVMKISFIET